MISIKMHTQPDDETCGPTCLHAIYHYFDHDISLDRLISEVDRSHSGGTLAPMLGKHALKNKFEAVIYVNNLNLFDPTWFNNDADNNSLLIGKLKQQLKYKKSKDIKQATSAFLKYLELGGKLRFESISVDLLETFFEKKIPILTGLSATYLYRSSREKYNKKGKGFYDDLQGTPCGHFVVLCGHDQDKKKMVVADPHRENPLSHNNYYNVDANHLINAILLGVLTYDANLLLIYPKGPKCKQ